MRIDDTPKPGAIRSEALVEALGDPYARRILATLVKRPRAVKDISQETQLPLPTTYRHVNRLVEQGLVVIERSALTEDGKRFELYRSRIKAARIEMDGAGERVTWEANEPVEDRLASLWDDLRGQVRRGG